MGFDTVRGKPRPLGRVACQSHTLEQALMCLPDQEADWASLNAFCKAHNPQAEFMEQWGNEYKARALELWGRSTQAFFQDSRPTGLARDEVLFCMCYQLAVAPYTGIPVDACRAYLHAMLNELRSGLLKDATAASDLSAREADPPEVAGDY